MYHAHFGLVSAPFSSFPTAAHFVATPGHEEALARLEFLGESRSACGLLGGPSGYGKTMLLEVFARILRRRCTQTAFVSAASADSHELLFTIACQLGVAVGPSLQTPRLLRAIVDRLAELRYDHVPTALLVDDVDRASDERLIMLDELLAALPPSDVPTVVLAGSFESMGRLYPPIARRADLRVEVPAWDEADIQQYITQRLTKSGCTGQLFEEGAIRSLLEVSGGNPRRVSQLANLALVAAAANEQPKIDANMVEEVCRELCVARC
jgi:type II secretory pathway predicted ATPase ExeA